MRSRHSGFLNKIPSAMFLQEKTTKKRKIMAKKVHKRATDAEEIIKLSDLGINSQAKIIIPVKKNADEPSVTIERDEAELNGGTDIGSENSDGEPSDDDYMECENESGNENKNIGDDPVVIEEKISKQSLMETSGQYNLKDNCEKNEQNKILRAAVKSAYKARRKNNGHSKKPKASPIYGPSLSSVHTVKVRSSRSMRKPRTPPSTPVSTMPAPELSQSYSNLNTTKSYIRKGKKNSNKSIKTQLPEVTESAKFPKIIPTDANNKADQLLTDLINIVGAASSTNHINVERVYRLLQSLYVSDGNWNPSVHKTKQRYINMIQRLARNNWCKVTNSRLLVTRPEQSGNFNPFTPSTYAIANPTHTTTSNMQVDKCSSWERRKLYADKLRAVHIANSAKMARKRRKVNKPTNKNVVNNNQNVRTNNYNANNNNNNKNTKSHIKQERMKHHSNMKQDTKHDVSSTSSSHNKNSNNKNNSNKNSKYNNNNNNRNRDIIDNKTNIRKHKSVEVINDKKRIHKIKSSKDVKLNPASRSRTTTTTATSYKVLGEALSTIGKSLSCYDDEDDNNKVISKSLQTLIESLMTSLGPLLCLTSHIPKIRETNPSIGNNLIDALYELNAKHHMKKVHTKNEPGNRSE